MEKTRHAIIDIGSNSIRYLGKAPEKAAVQDLAAELQFAMLGDFGKNSAPSAAATADPQELCAQFAACGIVPPEELIELQQRFAAAKAVLKL